MAIDADPDRDFTPTEIVRIFEATCQIQFPNEEQQNFCIALMKKIARRMSLPELKNSQIAGPITQSERQRNEKRAATQTRKI